MTVQPEFSRQARRWARLMAGLVAFGVGIALMKHADLGLGPWEVLNDGLSRITGVSLGTVGIVVGVPILLLWLPLRELRHANVLLFDFVLKRSLAHKGQAFAPGVFETTPFFAPRT